MYLNFFNNEAQLILLLQGKKYVDMPLMSNPNIHNNIKNKAYVNNLKVFHKSIVKHRA